MPPNKFGKLLLAAVEESLSSLGNSSRQAIFFHLESSFNITRENIPANLTEFSKALEGIFGPGASYLEKLIAKHLHEKLGLEFVDTEVGLLECVDQARRRITLAGGHPAR